MEGTGIKELERIVQNGVVITAADGKQYSVENLKRVLYDPRPDALTVFSLSGVIDYIKENVDMLALENCMIHVVDPETVKLVSDVHGESNQRHTILEARRDGDEFPFNSWIPQEEFIIMVRTLFEASEDREFIIKHTAKIDAAAEIQTMDDGVTQITREKRGVSGAITDPTEVKAEVTLTPFRTFAEVDQPESLFLFRMKTINNSVTCRLIPADNSAWKNTARANIAEYLKGSGVVVIA